MTEAIQALYESTAFWRLMCMVIILCDIAIKLLSWNNRRLKKKADRIGQLFNVEALKQEQTEALKIVNNYAKEVEKALQKLRELQDKTKTS